MIRTQPPVEEDRQVKRRHLVKTEPGAAIALPRVERAPNTFAPGQIVRVLVTNFTTYARGEFHCGPKLNLVIGPNGSGKLTLVAAICLGLGGKLELINRDKMDLMIKLGQDTALVEIELAGHRPGSNIVIRREFTAKKLLWTINGASANPESVREMVRSFNIQLDNLCHFLPQERVKEFATLSPERLLVETERTLGHGELARSHQTLIAKDGEVVEKRTRLEELELRKSKLDEERALLEALVARYEEYQAKKRDLHLHETLIPFAQYEDIKHQLEDLKEARAVAKAARDGYTLRVEPWKKHLEEATAAAQETSRAKTGAAKRVDELLVAYERQEKVVDDERLKVERLESEATQLRRRALKAKSELAEKQAALQRIRDKWSAHEARPSNDEIEAVVREREQVNGERAEVTTELANSTEQTRRWKDEVRKCQTAIEHMKSRLDTSDTLERLDPEGTNGNSRYRLRDQAYHAHVRMRELVKAGENVPTYYECPVVLCEVRQGYASMLETAVDNNTLFALTVESDNDRRTVERLLGQSINAPIRVVAPAPPAKPITLQNWGFDGVLTDFVTGPERVIQMLTSISRIHQIAVTSKSLSKETVENVMAYIEANQSYQLRRFIDAENAFNARISTYSKKLWYDTDKLGRPQHFRGSGVTPEAQEGLKRSVLEKKARIAELTQRIEATTADESPLRDRQYELQQKLSDLKEERDRLIKLQKEHSHYESRVEQLEGEVRELEHQANHDHSEAIANVEERLAAQFARVASLGTKLAETINQRAQALVQRKLAEMRHLQCTLRVYNLEALVRDFEREGVTLEENFRKADEELRRAKNSDARRKAKEVMEELNAKQDQRTTDELVNLITKYRRGQTFNERFILDRVAYIQDELGIMQTTTDASLVESLARKLAEIESLEQEIPTLRTDVGRLDEEIQMIQAEWEPQLAGYVETISREFNRRFTQVASDGRVELQKAERFKDWQLQILVKFRDGAESGLKVLDGRTQSGGERAVSTIFYIMSLQSVTAAPFRVVDEINQGMDQTNEQMAHKYLVHTSSSDLTLQYFLVTPKLLTSLYYSEDMVIHCIFTGDSRQLEPPATLGIDFVDFRRRFQ